MTEEIYLGRCVQGLAITPELLAAVLASATIEASDCSNNPAVHYARRFIDLIRLHASVIFRNNVIGTHETDVERDATLIPSGSQIKIHSNPCEAG
jgi:hypothetical protein